MARIGQERAGVGKHAHKVAQDALVSQSRELLAHADLVVVEPPGGAVLDLTGGRSLLEAAHDGIDHGVIDGVQAVQNGLGQAAGLLNGVEEIGKLVGRRVVGDAIVAGIGTELGKHGAVVVALAAKVQLHGPAQTDILAGNELHKGSLVLEDLFLDKRLGSQTLGKDSLDLVGGSRDVHNVVECVVGGAAAQLVSNVVALGNGSLHALKVADLNAGNLGKVLAVVGKLLAALDAQSGIGAHGGNDLNVKAVVGGNLLVPLKAVGGVVGSADHADVGLLDQVTAGKASLSELGVGKVPDLLGSLAVEDALVAKVALKLQVAPLKDGVANAATQGLGPLLELLASRGVASDKTLVDAVGTHQAPLVVVAAQPNLGDVLETLVLPNLLRRNVAVIVDDGHALGKVVEQLLAGLGAQQEILIVHKVFHQTAPLLARRAHGALVIL